MEVQQALPLATNGATLNSAPRKAATTGSDFETFLKLLTTQLRNQDPLEPLESTQFVAQLASFSAVEQQVQTNSQLSAILAALTGDGLQSLPQWLGKEILVTGSMGFTGEPLNIGKTCVPSAESAVMFVSNDFGAIVRQLAVDAGATKATWDGRLADGSMAAIGKYAFDFGYYHDGTLTHSEAGTTFSAVVEARLEGGNVMLITGNGTKVAAKDIGAVRSAQ